MVSGQVPQLDDKNVECLYSKGDHRIHGTLPTFHDSGILI